MRAALLLGLCLFWAIPAGAGIDADPPAADTWQPPEADVLKVKMLSYLHFQNKGNPDFRLTRMTWYDNPPDAELPGIVVALEYSTPSSGAGIQCGTLMWHRESDGDFTLVRDLDKAIDGTDQHSTDGQSGCGQP